MYRKIKTHISYKKGGVVIRPAQVGEEYSIGNWNSCYSGIKMGYETERTELYSDVTYVMTVNKSIVGYFMAYNEVNVGNNPDLPLYSKELIVYDFSVLMRAYAKYSKILIDYIIEYSKYNGYKAVSFKKEDKYNHFFEFLKRHYDIKEINDKFYIFNENPRIRSCQKYLTLYENDKISLEDLYFLYDLNFDILKTKCKFKLNETESIVVDRLTNVISFPKNVNIKKDNVILNEKIRNLVICVLEMYYTNKIENVDVYYDSNDLLYFEAKIGDLLYIGKPSSEITKGSAYKESLIQRGIDSVVPEFVKYDMNGGSFLFCRGIYKLKKQ